MPEVQRTCASNGDDRLGARVLTLERLQGLRSLHGSRHPRPASWSSPTSPATPPTSRAARSSTRPPSRVTSSRRSSAGWSRRSDWPSSRAMRPSCSSRTGAPTGRCCSTRSRPSYLAFRRRLRSIDQATSCDCNSCRLAPRLDLKLFVHHGAFVWSRIAGRDELAGSDVIVVHRLLKGTGAAEARANGFALFTAAAVDALGLDPDALGLRSGAGDDRASRPRRHVHPGPRGALAGGDAASAASTSPTRMSSSTSRRRSPRSRRSSGPT